MNRYQEMNRDAPYDKNNVPNRVFGFKRCGNHFLMESIIYNFEDTGYFHKNHYVYNNFNLDGFKIVIQPIRHPVDVAISLFATPWHKYRTFKEFIKNRFIDNFAEYYYSWKPIDIYRVKYEDLNINHEKTMNDVWAHFNLTKKFSKIKRVPKFVGHCPNWAVKVKSFIKESEKKYIIDGLKIVLEELGYVK